MEIDTFTLLKNFSECIDSSPHRNLIYSGISCLIDYMEEKPVNLNCLEEHLKKSVKIFSEDVEKQFTLTNEEDNENYNRYQRYMGKYAKSFILSTIGEKLNEDEQKQMKEDGKILLKDCLQSLELI